MIQAKKVQLRTNGITMKDPNSKYVYFVHCYILVSLIYAKRYLLTSLLLSSIESSVHVYRNYSHHLNVRLASVPISLVAPCKDSLLTLGIYLLFEISKVSCL